RRQGRRMHEVGGTVVAEDGVVAVVPVDHHRLAAVLRQQAMAGAEVPAARALAEVAGNGAEVADLRPGDVAGGLRHHRQLPAYLRVGGQLVEGHQRADAQARAVDAQAAQGGDAAERDDAARRLDAVLHQRQQVRAAGQGDAALGREQAHRLLDGGWPGILESLHQIPPVALAALAAFVPPWSAPASASSTRCGVSGRKGTRTPVALATALAMAAPGDTTGGSPRPTTPRRSYSGPVIICTTSSPTSPMPASL